MSHFNMEEKSNSQGYVINLRLTLFRLFHLMNNSNDKSLKRNVRHGVIQIIMKQRLENHPCHFTSFSLLFSHLTEIIIL